MKLASVSMDHCVGHNLMNGKANTLRNGLTEAIFPGSLERFAFHPVYARLSRIQDSSFCL
jgi:hypothetical protein